MESSPIKRRLTAILAADAVNYSRHMSVDEEGTLRQLAAHRAVIDRIIEAHEGRIVGTQGDSVLAEFASPVEAVRCAVEIQEGVHTRNETLPEADRLHFRIGVNLGDVMIDGSDILGDGVNVAARLEGIADPGGICISSSVYDQIAGKLSLGFVDLGEQSLKNIARPIRVYQFDRTGAVGGAKIARAARRKNGALAAGAALLLLVVAGAWQAGWFNRLVEPKPELPPAALPSVVAPAPASEEMKLKLQIAEAERAKAEAELAKSRSEAEAAKQRADAELARQRAAPRVVAEKKDAPPVPAVPAPMAAPTVSNASPGVGASNAATSAATGIAPAPSSVAPPAPPPAAVASIAPSPPPGVAFVPVVNGSGTATRDCEEFEEMRAFSEVQLAVRVDDGVITVERGTRGQAGYLIAKGRPTADGRLSLAGTAIAANRRNLGKEIGVFFSGAYTDGAFVLSGRTGSRTCRMTVRLDARR
jgi:class 3 adenylate cyclase